MASLVNIFNSDSVEVFSREIDEKWANVKGPRTVQSYFDYYYSGQDVQIYIEGLLEPLPLVNFAYSVEQKKTPVYGHASFVFDASMRGNRLVTGAFSVVTTHANYMTERLSEAAAIRQERRDSNNSLMPIRQDLENLQNYWYSNIDNALSPSGTKNIFSAHPPFNLIMVIGMQPDSNAILGDMDCDEVASMYSLDAVLHNDINERLMDSDPESSNRRLINTVELVKFDNQVTADGDLLVETYSFYARDEFPLLN